MFIFPFKPSCSITISCQHQCLAHEKGKGHHQWNVSHSWILKYITFGQKCKANKKTKSCALLKTKPVEEGSKQLLCSQSRQLLHSSSGSTHFSGALWHLAHLLQFLFPLSLPPGEGCTCCSILPCQLQQGDNDTDCIPGLARLRAH